MAVSQEQKIKNTIMRATDQIDNLIKVFRNDGKMWNAVEDMGGDVAWLADTVVALSKAANSLDEAYMSATVKDENVDEDSEAIESEHQSEITLLKKLAGI